MTKLFCIAGSAALLLLSLAEVSASGEEFCLYLTNEGAAETRSYPAAAGDLLTIAFTHSIYGSHVEERFQINGGSFESVDVRYSELRLAEFYGFESAARAGDWWVARPARRPYQSIGLRASQDSPIRISFRKRSFLLSDGAARVSLGRCQHPIHG